MEKEKKRYWERKHGFLSEFDIDARWILREQDDNNDPPKAWGSLRIVSHPDLKPGYLKAYVQFITSRRPRTEDEMKKAIEEYDMDIKELEVYSVDEHVTVDKIIHEAPKRQLEEIFDIKIFN